MKPDATFDGGWLALRRSADARARSADLAARAAAALPERPLVVDLGTGTGANRAYLGPKLPDARWRLVDHDARLLARAGAVDDERRCLDLSIDVDAALDGAPDLVTASALLDLVSEDWLRRLAACPAAMLFALSVDGRVRLAPRHDLDGRIDEAVRAHQGRDKGFGGALGIEASAALRRVFAGRGIEEADSTWTLRAGRDDALIAAYLAGRAEAAAEQGVGEEVVARWLEVPRDAVDVGHVDVFIPPQGT